MFNMVKYLFFYLNIHLNALYVHLHNLGITANYNIMHIVNFSKLYFGNKCRTYLRLQLISELINKYFFNSSGPNCKTVKGFSCKHVIL